MFRVVAVDHDLISFVDVKHNHNKKAGEKNMKEKEGAISSSGNEVDCWPIVLITMPKPATYMMPQFEPLHRMRTSTHIR